MKAEVMRRAWELAREGQEKFGGSTRQYLAESLRIAWAEVKRGYFEKEMFYGTYKKSFSGCKTVRDSYNRDTRTIVVLIPVNSKERARQMMSEEERMDAFFKAVEMMNQTA